MTFHLNTMTQQLIIKYYWSKCQNRSLGYFQNRLFCLLALYQFKNRKFCWNLLQLKHRKLAPPFFQPLTVQSDLKGFFHYWGHYMAILRPSERNAKKDKTVLHSCVCSICSMFIKIYSKMACCLLVGTKSGRMKYLRKSFSSLVF